MRSPIPLVRPSHEDDANGNLVFYANPGNYVVSYNGATVAVSVGPDEEEVVRGDLGGVEIVSTVATTGATETLDLADGNVFDVTMDQACVFTFTGASAGVACSLSLILRGAFTPTWPGSVIWPSGVAPTHATPAVYEFLTVDGGTVWFGFPAGTSFA